MVFIRWFVLIGAMIMAFLTGFCQGMNRGHDVALQFDPQCKAAK